MKIVKFHVSKIKPNYRSIKTSKINDCFDFKIIGFLSYRKHIKNGWTVNYVEIFLITNFIKKWEKLKLDTKATIIVSIILTLISVL